MDRRRFLKQTIAAGVVTAVQAEAVPAPKRTRPMNVLYAFSDQHRAHSVPGEPFSQAIAPHLEEFHRKNFSMDRCISNYPLCTPYRGILMTGTWPYQSGLIHNNLQIGNQHPSIADTFRTAGYHTGYVGKWHLSSQDHRFTPAGPQRQGFEDWRVWCSTDDHYTAHTYDPNTGTKIAPQGYSATHMTDDAITFLKKQSAAKPWMLVVSWNPPHPPFDPPAEERNLYQAETLKLRPNVQISGTVHQAALRRAEQGYYGAITAIDKEFARLLQTLEETGQEEDTIVIYTSDHGEMMGSQGWMGKRLPHDESCRVPFYVRYPGVTQAGGQSETLFASIDIYPTLCGLAGLTVPEHCKGRDLSAAIHGKSVDPSEAVFLMNEANFGDRDGHPPIFRGVRTPTHTYAVADNGRWCLYDNTKDPYQLKNLVRNSDQAPLMAELDTLITAWLKSTSDPFPMAIASQKISPLPVYDNKFPRQLRDDKVDPNDN